MRPLALRATVLALALLIAWPASAASRYFVNGGVDNNWGSTSNWSTTSGGSGGSSVPTSADDVFFDGNSPNVTIDASVRAAKTLTFTGYTNTITFSQTLEVSGSITLASGMTFAGTGTLWMSATGTFTSNGKAVGVPLTLGGNTCTITLADALTANALLYLLTYPSSTTTINASTLTANASITVGDYAAGVVTGTTEIIAGGTGTISAVNAPSWRNPVTINSSGTVTLSGTVAYRDGTFKYTAGALAVASGGKLVLNSSTTTVIDFGGGTMPWGIEIQAREFETMGVKLASELKTTGYVNLTATNGYYGSTVTLGSTSGGVARKLTFLTGATYRLINVTTTDIDSSDSVGPVYYSGGSVSNTTNWTALYPFTAGDEIGGGGGGGGEHSYVFH